MAAYLLLIVGAVLVNNFVLTRFLGICPFLGVSKKLSTALGMCGAVVFVMTSASAVTWVLQHRVLNPLGLLGPCPGQRQRKARPPPSVARGRCRLSAGCPRSAGGAAQAPADDRRRRNRAVARH